MQIAVATKDGINVNEHFGKAKQFRIYEVYPDSFDLIRICQLETPYSQGEDGHDLDENRLQTIAEQLRPSSKVFVTKIGQAPAQKLRQLGIEPFEAEGLISQLDV